LYDLEVCDLACAHWDGVPWMVAGKQHGLRSFVVLFFAQVLLK
jgi:hypothetical protein